ncbi:MAG: cyanophycin synthetase [Candidatus Azotimanducaceae bacterium]|jgi:cyanophycin synthetase
MIDFDGRRLTGANFFCEGPAVVIDVCLQAVEPKEIALRWIKIVSDLLAQLGRPEPEVIGYRIHDLGQSFFFTEEIDGLYSSIDLAEAALKIALNNGAQSSVKHYQDLILSSSSSLRAGFEEESNPKLLALQAQAKQQNVPFLWDDDFVSLGYGLAANIWPVDQTPAIDDIADWSQYRSIPLAFVTGTNGKSTTTRLASQILRGSGITIGFSSTDGIWAGDECLDHGDYSGPGGAREVLRNPKVDAAILEVARGGMLRRGLGATKADVALITNVAEDHLGEYGVNTLTELIEAKFIVRKSLGPDGKLILNADDAGIVSFVQKLGTALANEIVWFSLDKNNPHFLDHFSRGGSAYFIDGKKLVAQTGAEVMAICKVTDVPITLNGYAKHNIYNALAAAALTHTMGASIEQVRVGLCSFAGDQKNNPGRGNIFTINGATMMVDFAHNPHGLNAVVDTLLQYPAQRRLVMLGHAGDRSDDDIRNLTEVAGRLKPDLVVIYELEGYLRGRSAGEIPSLISNVMTQLGLTKDQIVVTPNPVAAAQHALAWAREGDVLLLQTLGDRDKVLKILESQT